MKQIAEARVFELIDDANRGNRKGEISPQSIIVVAFLERYGELNAMPCQTGRGSTEESFVRYLLSSFSVDDVYKEYEEQWKIVST